MDSEYKTEMESGDNRFNKCSLVIIKEFTMIMQELLNKSETPAKSLYTKIKDGPRSVFFHINDSQIEMLESLKTYGYDRLDISLAYKIAFHMDVIPKPSRGWGQEPRFAETNIGDDVERIRVMRNRFVHSVNTNISIESFKKFFKTCINIGKRVDEYLKHPSDSGFERAMICYQCHPLDPALERHHLDALAEIKQLKGNLQCKIGDEGLIVHVIISPNMKQQAYEKINKTGVDGKIGLKIIFHGIDESEDNISLMNSLKEILNTNNISFNIATKGSIKVFIDVKKKIIVDEIMFVSEIKTFIRKLFISCKLKCMVEETADAVITISEGDFEGESKINTLEPNREVDQADEKFSTTLESLFKDLAGKGNDDNLVGKGGIDAEIVPLVVTGDFKNEVEINTREASNEVDQGQEKFSTTLEGFFKDLAGKSNNKNKVGKDDMDDALVPHDTDRGWFYSEQKIEEVDQISAIHDEQIRTKNAFDCDSESKINTLHTNSEDDQAQEKFSTTLEVFFNDLAGKKNEKHMIGKDCMDEAHIPPITGDFESESLITLAQKALDEMIVVRKRLLRTKKSSDLHLKKKSAQLLKAKMAKEL